MTEFRMNEHVTCVICSSIFNDPCTLTCGHSFCRVCLTKHTKNHPSAIKSRTLPCAVCRQFTKVLNYSRPVDEWAWQIKPSLLLQGLLDTERREKQYTDTCCACEGVGETTPATFWCKKCNLLLCGSCAKMHTKAPLTKNHDVLLISEAVKKKIEIHNKQSKQIKVKERTGLPGSMESYQADMHTYRTTTGGDHNRAHLPMVLPHPMDERYHLDRNPYRAFEPIEYNPPGMQQPTLFELRPYAGMGRLISPPVVDVVGPPKPVQFPLVYNSNGVYSGNYHGLSPSRLNRRYDQMAEEPEYSGIPFEVYRGKRKGKGKREFILTDVAYETDLKNASNGEVASSQMNTNSSNEHTSVNEEASSQASTNASDESIYWTIAGV